jgi:hypothetical protein
LIDEVLSHIHIHTVTTWGGVTRVFGLMIGFFGHTASKELFTIQT